MAEEMTATGAETGAQGEETITDRRDEIGTFSMIAEAVVADQEKIAPAEKIEMSFQSKPELGPRKEGRHLRSEKPRPISQVMSQSWTEDGG